ncbi:MAG: RCC1 domain-containing protein [Niabella sp.]
MRKVFILLFAVVVFASCKKDKVNNDEEQVPTVGVAQFSSGGGHTMLLKTNGDLWGIGWNDFGFLGTGNTENQTKWVKVASNVKSVAAGFQETFIIKTDNTLWGTGRNIGGNLGDGTNVMKTSFVKLADNVKAVYAGLQSTFIIKTDNSVWAAGFNYWGMLGTGPMEPENKYLFTKVILDNVKMVAPGVNHTLFLKTDGTVWAVGANNNGALGLGTTSPSSLATPMQIAEGIIKIVAGDMFNFLLANNGQVKVCGYGNGAFGNGSTDMKTALTSVFDGAVDIGVSQSKSSSFIISADGTLYVAGNNQYGNLGLGNTDNQLSWKIAATGVKSVSAGSYHTTIQKTDGSIWATGADDAGQLGDGTVSAMVKTSFVKVAIP